MTVLDKILVLTLIALCLLGIGRLGLLYMTKAKKKHHTGIFFWTAMVHLILAIVPTIMIIVLFIGEVLRQIKI